MTNSRTYAVRHMIHVVYDTIPFFVFSIWVGIPRKSGPFSIISWLWGLLKVVSNINFNILHLIVSHDTLS